MSNCPIILKIVHSTTPLHVCWLIETILYPVYGTLQLSAWHLLLLPSIAIPGPHKQFLYLTPALPRVENIIQQMVIWKTEAKAWYKISSVTMMEIDKNQQ